MTEYEKLMARYDDLHVEEKIMVNDGLYADGHIWISKDMPKCKRYCTLAEEIGHHKTSVGNILDQSDIDNCDKRTPRANGHTKKYYPLKAYCFPS